jgi:hypothetical protein
MVLRGQDAWRRHPIFQWKVLDMFPGIREGVAAFGVYVVAEYAYKKWNAPPPRLHHAAAAAAEGKAEAH